MPNTILVFDSHPVQYRAPIWQSMEKLLPGSIHVAYASDCTVRGYADKEFRHTVAWDVPMLNGYSNSILNCEKGNPLANWGSLTGAGVKQLIRDIKPAVVLLTGLNYRFDLVAYINARKYGIPVWLRCETQDQAFRRSRIKSMFRSFIYKIAYKALDRVFYIGELNKKHYLRHDVTPFRLKPARYATVDKFTDLKEKQKMILRNKARLQAGIAPTSIVVGFSGRFITKKNPELLFHMLDHLPAALRNKIHLYFMGSGDLQNSLERMAGLVLQRYGVKTFFSGFVNQSQLAPHYLAMDIMVLPSRKLGETWGLVANEAMQAGCAVIVSDAAGCSKDFFSWERFRIFKEGDSKNLASCVAELATIPRDFDWARQNLRKYSIEASANAILTELAGIPSK